MLDYGCGQKMKPSPPQGTLTGTQLEIMESVWAHGPDGLAVGEIWQALAARRTVARTTVLTLVSRLEKRGWLVQTRSERAYRYRAARGKTEASQRLAAEFADTFFGGSASRLVMSLLGSKRIHPDELERLRTLLAEARGRS